MITAMIVKGVEKGIRKGEEEEQRERDTDKTISFCSCVYGDNFTCSSPGLTPFVHSQFFCV